MAEQTESDEKIERATYLAARTSLIIAFAILGAVAWFSWASRERAYTGSFGDSFGPLTALFTGLALAGLWFTIRLQKIELEAARQVLASQEEHLRAQSYALSKQNFENTFFRLLGMIDERACSLADPVTNDLARRGRGGFRQHVEQLNRTQGGAFDSGKNDREAAKRVYQDWVASGAPELLTYFQLTEEVLRFVDNNTSINDKAPYVSMLRAAMSPTEHYLLFYHALFGTEDGTFAQLLAKQAFFDPLSLKRPYPISDARRAWFPKAN